VRVEGGEVVRDVTVACVDAAHGDDVVEAVGSLDGLVVERITNAEAGGATRIENGEVWTARAYDEDHVIDAGARVEVVEIRGATALVTE